MKIRLKSEDVNYDPKTDEYEVDINHKLYGFIFNIPIFIPKDINIDNMLALDDYFKVRRDLIIQ